MSEQRQSRTAEADKQAIDPPGARGGPGAAGEAAANEADWLYFGPATLPAAPPPVRKVGRQHRVTGVVEWKDAPEPKPGEAEKTPREVFAGS